MSGRLHIRWPDAFAGAAAFLFSLVTFVIAAPMDPEPYHDGSQLPAAIAVSEGMVVHRDVFSAYGFITAWLQGLAVTAFGPRLIVIRMFTAVLLALVALLMYVLARWATRSTMTALAVTAVWIVAWPGRAVSWGTPLLPWPSVVYLVFQLAAVLLVVRGLLFLERRRWMLAAGGVLTALAILTRLNYGVPFSIALLAALILFTRSRQLGIRDWAAGIVGALFGLAVPLAVIAAQGAFPAFVDQSIIGPLQGKAIVKPTEWFYYENAYLWGSALLLVSLLAILWLGSRRWIGPRTFALLVTLDVIGLTLWTSTAIEGSPLRNLILSKVTWSPALDGQAMQPLFFAAIMTLLFAASVVIVVIARFLKRTPTSGSRDQIVIVVLALTGAASLVQLWPVADPNHLWWAAPIPLTLLVYGLTVTAGSKARWAIPAVIAIPVLLVSVVTTTTYLAKPRTEITTGTLAGMKIDSRMFPSIAKVDRFLADVAPRSTNFQCAGGLFAVWNGEYLASGPSYVDYAYGVNKSESSGTPVQTILCFPRDLSRSDKANLSAQGIRVVSESGEVVLSYFTDIDMIRIEHEANSLLAPGN